MNQPLYQGSAPEVRQAPVLPDPRNSLDIMLNALIANEASDLHLQANEPPRFRKDGELIRIPMGTEDGLGNYIPDLTRTMLERIISTVLLTGGESKRFVRACEIAQERLNPGLTAAKAGATNLSAEQLKEREQEDEHLGVGHGFDVDIAYDYGEAARFRVNISLERSNPRVVMRRIPTEILSLKQLKMPESVYELATYERGLVLVTGPTGSGKSTTLAAIIDHINTNRACSILTIEDPVEFVHRSKKAMVAQREIGEDTPTFKEALRRALRQDPDVILVGEMRDLETMRIALDAAETGHLVFGTLHTKSAKDTLTRIVNEFPEGEQQQIKSTLVSALRAVVGQTLIPKIGGGRTAGLEIMKVNPAIRSQLASPSGFGQIEDSIRGSQNEGNQLLDDHLFRMATERTITPAAAIKVANDRKALNKRLNDAGLSA